MDARCPRCSTVFTTDRSGIQFCPNCGQQVDVPEPPPGLRRRLGSVSRPRTRQEAAGSAPAASPASPHRAAAPSRGTASSPPGSGGRSSALVQGFFETWKRSMFSPQQFFPTVRPDVPWTEALFYAWIIHGFTVVLALPFVGLGLFRPGIPSNFGADTAQMENMMRAMSGGVGVAWALGTLLLYPLVVLATAGIVHLFAMLFGAAKNGYGATVRALCYAQGPNVFGIIPCLGFLAWIYSVVLDIFGISSLQETSTGKAAGIVLLPILFVFCCCGLLALLLRRGHRRAGQRDGRQRRHLALGSR